MTFLEYLLRSDALYLGERPKGNIFKPCIKTIPFTQITGALRKKFEIDDIKAVGYLVEDEDFNQPNYLIYSPRDRYSNLSKIPLQVEFLTNVLAKVFVLKTESTERLPENFEIVMGGLKSKGFGSCTLVKQKEISAQKFIPGTLRVRIPEEEVSSFGIKRVLRPVYGYLFKPTPHTFTGVYVRSLFEGSEVVGPEFLLEPLGG